jgi:hypothetical protein
VEWHWLSLALQKLRSGEALCAEKDCSIDRILLALPMLTDKPKVPAEFMHDFFGSRCDSLLDDALSFRSILLIEGHM